MKQYIPLLAIITFVGLGAAGYLAIENYGLQTLVSTVGVAGIASIIFAESGLLIGFFLPGDSLLFTAGFLVQQDIIQFNIHLLALILFVAAALGDSVGYTFGRRVGRKIFDRENSALFNTANLKLAEDFYKKHGGKTIVIARFVPVVRTFAPIIAGVSHMKYKQFLAYNLIGAFVWAVGLTYVGYFAGAAIERYNINIEYVILGIIFISVAPPAIHILREKKQRDALKAWITRQVRALFGRQ